MLSSLTLALVAFAFIFGSTLLGNAIRTILPEHHLSEDTKDTVKLGTGLIATLAALVLGLLIASAKGTFDTMTNELRVTGSKIILLDRVMAQYGPETMEAREFLRLSLTSAIQRIWPDESHFSVITPQQQPSNDLESLQGKLLQLNPNNDAQRWLQSRALQVSAEIAEARWLLLTRVGQGSIPKPFLVVLIAWLSVIFATFGLFYTRNKTVIIVMFICALSAAASLFLIMELDQPYEGFIKLSSSPLTNALNVIGK